MEKIFLIAGLTGTFLWQSNAGFAQGTSLRELPQGWHLMDKAKDGVYGISMDKAYDFVKGKKSTPVIVAVIDSGIDTLHEDLKEVLWTNPGEIPGNKIDDDKNGYVDDVHGWNFIGGKDGRNVKTDSYEGSRIYLKLKKTFSGIVVDTASLTPEQREQYATWLKVKSSVEGEASGDGEVEVKLMSQALNLVKESDSILQKQMGKAVFSGKDLDAYTPSGAVDQKAKTALLSLIKANNMLESSNKEFVEGFSDFVMGEIRKKEAAFKAPPDYRAEIVKDDESDINDRFYGNNDIMANTPLHGTHVSGIIAAKRNNGKGGNGIADNARIMTIRAVPDGDEHDKDIALGIRYAVDNGAKVINMSFGKGFSPEKHWVDSAVTYAASKGVLLVHAAGNDAKNVDSSDNFPNPNLKALKSKASNWITVGASSDLLAEPSFKSYTASFSNYGKKEVDVFSPGTRIYSTLPGGNTYGNLQGTSMASPVVAGVAAFILSYYPQLSPEQVKYVIEKSASKVPTKVKVPGSEELVDMSEISVSGGVINAYEAVKLAATLKPENKNEKLPKSVLKNKKD